MKTLRTFFALFCLFILTRCTKSNDDSTPNPPVDSPKKIIQLKIDTSFHTDQSDNWVLAHDINGKLLEFKSFESGDLLLLETTRDIPGDKISITLFRYFRDSVNEHSLATYHSLSPGQEWTLKKDIVTTTGSNPNNGNKIGSFKVSVSGVPEGSAFMISNKYTKLGDISWGSGSFNTVNFSSNIYDNGPSWLLYVADHTGMPKYKFYNNVADNSTFNETFSSLNNYDKTITITFPQTKVADIFYLVSSYEPGQPLDDGYLTNSNFLNSYFARPNDQRSSITLGFLDMFPINKIFLDIKTPTYKYFYYRLGATPEDIKFPGNGVFTIPDRSFENFHFQSSEPFKFRISLWQYENSTTKISWSTASPEQSVQKISELPSEFGTKYPQLLINNLGYVRTHVYTAGQTYVDLVEENFKGKSRSDTYEICTVTVD